MKSFLFSNLPVFFAFIILLVLTALFSGCYTLKQGTTMLGYLSRAVPLEELGGSTGENNDELRFVQRVEDIRRFAMEELGLKESRNYTRYVELDRDYLAAVVSASASDSFTRHEWWFPVVGRVPYKGFFNVDDARKERAKLEKKGLDVWIRGVDAFSTLGWFRDPLYSYMKNYSDRYLAELIIHELFHATVYIKSHSAFNEQLAEFVGTEGAKLYMAKRASGELNNTESHSVADAEEDEAIKADRLAFYGFIHGLIAELNQMYESKISREEKLKQKEEIIETAKSGFMVAYEDVFKTDRYRFLGELPINNAYLDLYRLYHEEDDYFKKLYESRGSDLVKFIAAAKTLRAGRRQNPRAELEKALAKN